ncbi:MAG: hypothetical protein Q4G24_01920 [Paracoccus sp. (in: a-proteobacteria)]|uniref:hypothetical protein n=1 Tax=Paracoccus sp. TaxID=267 RepID=UPI0026E0CE88|nr:hypothetical protein [Paracoccus sp. (in: a-proteobacteria)]MDO5620208.1 hypothetical protein [Paracoccus sp. (in: a-proteobacteria)]
MYIKYFLALPLIVLLAAGSSAEPSEGEMRQAIQAEFDKIAPLLPRPIKVLSFQKNGCIIESTNTYNCTFTAEAEGPNMRTGKTDISKSDAYALFEKTGGGWIAKSAPRQP